MRGTLLRLSAPKPPPPSSSSFLSRYTAAKRNESDQSKAIESAMSALPPTVNRPDQRAIHFPKALDPDRAFIYSKKIEKTRKPTSMGFRIFNICLYALCAGVAYWSMFVRDWDDRVLGGKWRRDRLKRLALHRDLTAEEAAILARPEPPDRTWLSPMYIISQIPLNFAIQKEIRKARREQYLENKRLEEMGLDVPVKGLKVNWEKYGLDNASSREYQEVMDETMDWGAVLLEEED